MPIEKLEIVGLRGFAKSATLSFAVPSGRVASGLTLLVGPNSSGKSVVVEALRAMQHPGTSRSFPEKTRNAKAGNRVRITLHYSDDDRQSLQTVDAGGSETEWKHFGSFTPPQILVIPSRRAFNATFARQVTARNTYMQQTAGSGSRPMTQDGFGGRLFQIQNNRKEFDAVLKRVLDAVPDWYIELRRL